MRRLKRFVFTLTLLPLSLYPQQTARAADSCSEIANQLIVLEAAIQSEKLPRCGGESQENCCDPAKDLSCKTFLELQTKHNELMGKLVIYEGLVSIGKAIEADHTSIQNLDPKDLKKAKRKVSGFLNSYRKASLLDTSLKADFWVDESGNSYSGNDISDLKTYMAKQCKREDQSIQAFCKLYLKSSKEKGASQLQLDIALANFARADGYSRLSPADRFNDYEKYQKALEIRINGEKLNHVSNLGRLHPHLEKIHRLRDLLEEAQSGIDDEKAKEVLSIAKSLDGLDVNYGELVKPTEKFEEFFDSNIASGIAGFNQASRALLNKDKMLENMDKLSSVFKNHQKSAMSSIEKTILDKTGCQGSGQEILACFKKECAPSVTGACTQTKDPRKAQTLHSINAQLKALKNYSVLEDRIQESRECLKKQVTEEVAKSCVSQLSRKIGMATKDEADSVRQELAKVEFAMENMNQAQNISDLKLSKAMGLMAYKTKGCLKEDKVKKVSDFELVCSGSPIENYSQEAIELSSAAGKILEFSQNPFINKDLSMPSKKFSIYKEEFLKQCKQGRGNSSLCDMYQHDELVSGRAVAKIKAAARSLKAQKSANRRMPSKRELKQPEEEDPAALFLAGLGKSFVAQGVPFFLSYDAADRRHKQMMSYHKNRLSYLNSQYEWQQANSTIPVYQYPYTNYGYSLYGYNDYSSFGGTSSPQLYSYSDDFTQFNFAPSMVMSQFSSSNYSSSTNLTPDQSTGFNFD